MRPLLAAGELPNIRRLLERGSLGVLHSRPPMLSPALWTEIATGLPRRLNGIDDFTHYGGAFDVLSRDGRLVSSNDRVRTALWNWADHAGLETGVVAWWATWPAEAVRGFVVSDRMAQSRWAAWTGGERAERLTHPPALAERLADLVFDPSQPPMDEIRRLVSLDAEEEAEMLAARKPIFAHGPSVFKFAYCAQRSYEEIALKLLGEHQPDFSAVFLIANDPASHTFWHYYEPGAFSEEVPPDEAERLGKLIPNMYRHNDAYLGRLLAVLDDDTTVIIVSDHGFQASGILPAPRAGWRRLLSRLTAFQGSGEQQVAVGQSGMHREDGLILVSGPGIERGLEIDAQLLDVAPTVAHLLGLPASEEWPGRVLTELFTEEPAPDLPVSSMDAYVSSRTVAAQAIDDDGIRDQLRALGYVE